MMVALTIPAATLLALTAMTGEAPPAPILTTAMSHVKVAPGRRAMGPENVAPGRVPLDTITVSGSHVAFARTDGANPLFVRTTGERYSAAELPSFTATQQSIPSNSVRALRFQGTGRRPRGEGGNGPLTTRLMLRLTGDAHSVNSEFGIKGGIASAVQYALDQ